jgi:hypothetical protein
VTPAFELNTLTVTLRLCGPNRLKNANEFWSGIGMNGKFRVIAEE